MKQFQVECKRTFASTLTRCWIRAWRKGASTDNVIYWPQRKYLGLAQEIDRHRDGEPEQILRPRLHDVQDQTNQRGNEHRHSPPPSPTPNHGATTSETYIIRTFTISSIPPPKQHLNLRPRPAPPGPRPPPNLAQHLRIHLHILETRTEPPGAHQSHGMVPLPTLPLVLSFRNPIAPHLTLSSFDAHTEQKSPHGVVQMAFRIEDQRRITARMCIAEDNAG